MAYCTVQQVKDQFPLADGLTHIADYISRADSEIDALLAGAGYPTPLSSPPEIIERLSILKSGIMCWDEADSTVNTAVPFAADPIRAEIDKIESRISLKEYRIAAPTVSFGPTVNSDALDSTDNSNFSTGDLELQEDD